MRQITKLMINEFKLKELGYDMMGYTFKSTKELSFHHLRIPKRMCQNIEGKGYTRNNGAILKQSSSHEYLHTIELYDRDMFLAITRLLCDENDLGRIDKDILVKIRDILLAFEAEYEGKKNGNGKLIIKKEYTNRIEL